MSATCKSCGAAIIWGKTAKGKAMPLVADPYGDLVLAGNPPVVERVASPSSALQRAVQDEFIAGRQYHSHFADCPNAAQHRKAAR